MQKKYKKSVLQIKRSLFFIFKEVRSQNPLLFILYILKIVFGIFGTLLPLFLQRLIIDDVVLLLANSEKFTFVLRETVFLILLTLALDFIISVAQALINRRIEILGECFNVEWNLKLNLKAMSMDYKDTESVKVLEMIEKAKEGKDWYSGGITGILSIFFDTIQSFGTIATLFVFITTKCPYLIPIQVMVLIIVAAFNSKNNRLAIEVFRKQSKNNRIFLYYFFNLSDYRNAKEIRLFDCKNIFLDKMNDLAEKQLEHRKNFAKSVLKYSIFIELVDSLKDFFSFLFIGIVFFRKKLSVGDFVFCINSASNFYNNATSIIRNFQELIKRSIYMNQFINFIEISGTENNRIKKVSVQDITNHILEFKNVSFKYPNSSAWALKDINLKLTSDDTVALVGVNGSGKTTLIKLLCRLYDTTEGKIFLDGIDICNYDIEEYRKLFSCVFQDFKIFAFSLKDNVCLNEKYDEKKFCKIISDVFLNKCIADLPLRENTPIEKGFNRNAVELSCGQKQKISIARATYKNSEFLVMDEPTASLDYVSESKLYNKIENSSSDNKIKLYISHRLYSCKFCKRIIVIDKGKIISEGTHNELLYKNLLYRKMFFQQANLYSRI